MPNKWAGRLVGPLVWQWWYYDVYWNTCNPPQSFYCPLSRPDCCCCCRCRTAHGDGCPTYQWQPAEQGRAGPGRTAQSAAQWKLIPAIGRNNAARKMSQRCASRRNIDEDESLEQSAIDYAVQYAVRTSGLHAASSWQSQGMALKRKCINMKYETMATHSNKKKVSFLNRR